MDILKDGWKVQTPGGKFEGDISNLMKRNENGKHLYTDRLKTSLKIF